MSGRFQGAQKLFDTFQANQMSRNDTYTGD